MAVNRGCSCSGTGWRSSVSLCLRVAVLCVWFTAGTIRGLECWECPDLQSTFIRHVESYYNYSCSEEQVTLTATIRCRDGFRQTGETYESLCTCNEDLCEWEDSGKCEIETLSVILCGITLFAVTIVFILLFILICKCYST